MAATTQAVCNLGDAAARVVCLMPASQLSAPALQLCQSCGAVLERSAGQQVSPRQITFTLAVLGSLFKTFGAAAVKHASLHPTYMQLVEALWPPVQTVACNEATSSPAVVAALCSVLQYMVSGAGSQQEQLLVHVAPALHRVFLASGHAACLDALADAVEHSGTSGAAHSANGAAAGLQTLLSAVNTCVDATLPHGDAVAPDVRVAALNLVSRCVLFLPAHSYQGHVAQVTLSAAVHGLQSQERPVVQAALQLLTHTLVPSKRQRQQIKELHVDTAPLRGIVQQHMGSLMHCLLVVLCTTCPQESWAAVGRLVYGVMSAYPESAVSAWHANLADAAFPPLASTPLSAEDCHKVAQLATKGTGLPERRFMALMQDFAGIAHGMSSSSDLVAHEMAPQRQTAEVITL